MKKILISGPAHSVHVQRWFEGVKSVDSENVYYLLDSSGLRHEKADFKIHRLSPKVKIFKPVAFVFNFVIVGIQLIWLKYIIGVNLVHSHWTGDVTSFLVALIWRHKQIQNPWGTDILLLPQKSFLHWLLLRATYKLTSHFMTDAKHVKEKLISMGVSADNINIIYFGTDVEYFSPGGTSNLRLTYNINPVSKLIYSNRSLFPVYDIATIIRAASRLPQHVFVISGGGPLEADLKNMSKKLSLENVVFVGRIPFDDLRDFLRESDCYVSSSKSDAGLAASIAEAMATGTPVVCSEFGDNSEWVVSSSAGLVFEIGNDVDLANKIQEVLANPKSFKGGRDKICSDNNSKLEMQKAADIYTKVI